LLETVKSAPDPHETVEELDGQDQDGSEVWVVEWEEISSRPIDRPGSIRPEETYLNHSLQIKFQFQN